MSRSCCEHGAVPVIETEPLTKSYGSARGIEDVTITVEAGGADDGVNVRICSGFGACDRSSFVREAPRIALEW
jgi:hypothetical protein